MSDVAKTLWKLGACVVLGMVGLAMVFWGLERSALIDRAAVVSGADGSVPQRVFLTLYVGLMLLWIAVLWALTVWSKYLRAHPETRQAPVWALMLLIALSGTAGLLGFAQHWGHINGLDPVPTEVSEGFIAGQVMAGIVVIGSLVVMGVRWAPGHRRPLVEH